jgi:hypothetical protein
VTIKFVCGCGKRLRAGDDMARVRVRCPGCGDFVGVPSLEPTVVGGQRPMTPRERIRHTRNNPPPPEAVAAEMLLREVLAGPKEAGRRVRLRSGDGPRRPPTRPLERHWYEFLIYPLSAWRLCLGLAVALTLLSAGLLVWLPTRLNTTGPADDWAERAFYLSVSLIAILTAGLPCTFLERVLASAAGGEVDDIVWSGTVLGTFATAGARWLGCFLAGPAVLAAVGWLYWQRCGESIWDVLVLVEISVVAVAYFILALAAVVDRGRWRDLSPLAVADLAHRLRRRALAVVAAAVGVLALGMFMLAGVAAVHRGEFRGWLMLTGGWFVGVFAGTFFARLLGVWCYLTRPR